MANPKDLDPTTMKLEEDIEEYTNDKIEAGRAWLIKFGIDASGYSAKEVVEKLNKIREAKKAAVEVLARGPTIDAMEMLLEYVPEGFVGEFKAIRDTDIHRAEALGWQVFKHEKASKKTTTASSDNTVRLGDTILMIIPEEMYVARQLTRLERRQARKNRATLGEQKRAERETSDWEIPVVKL